MSSLLNLTPVPIAVQSRGLLAKRSLNAIEAGLFSSLLSVNNVALTGAWPLAAGLTASGRAMADHPDDIELSELLSAFEFTEVIFCFGFLGWVQKCMEATGMRGLGALDVVVLHAVNHRTRGRRVNEIAMVLNIEDTHLIAYALKKLVAAELVRPIRAGRESRYETTEKGDAACEAYRDVRQRYLIPSVRQLLRDPNQLEAVSVFLRTLSGTYDQAGRFATAYSSGLPRSAPVKTKR